MPLIEEIDSDSTVAQAPVPLPSRADKYKVLPDTEKAGNEKLEILSTDSIDFLIADNQSVDDPSNFLLSDVNICHGDASGIFGGGKSRRSNQQKMLVEEIEEASRKEEVCVRIKIEECGRTTSGDIP